nr:dienelactone hydrolase family protein [Citrobacter freundii]
MFCSAKSQNPRNPSIHRPSRHSPLDSSQCRNDHLPTIDDSRLLFQTLQAHQQPCQYKMYPGTLHAFLHYSRVMKTADEALQDGARFFKQQL